jgi:hypothetical protein
MKNLLFLAFLFSLHTLPAQNLYDQIWVFDKYIIFDFSQEPPLITLEDPDPWLGPGDFTTSICNKYGALQFYTGGCFIGNRLHEVMENGDSINSSIAFTGWCYIGDLPIFVNNTLLPWPDDTSKYIVFNLDMSPVLQPDNLYYHYVDMSLDGGLGAVTEKLQVAVDHEYLAAGPVTACRHTNGEDWWVITPKHNSNCYYVIPVDSNGVGEAVEQCIALHFGEYDSGGQAKFSPDGTKYARMEPDNGTVVMDFDASTGVLSSPVELEFNDPYAFSNGLSFSGNSQYVYVSATDRVYQFDTDAADIQASLELVGLIDPDTLATGMGSMALSQLAPNGKIYIASAGLHRYLSVINRPNCPGALCDFRAHSLELPANNYGGINNLPSFRILDQTYDCEPVSSTAPELTLPTVLLAPNPVGGSGILRVELGASGMFELVGLDGRVLITNRFEAGVHSLELACSPGLYIYSFRSDSGGIPVFGKLVVE